MPGEKKKKSELMVRFLSSSENEFFLLLSRVKFKDPLYEDGFVFKAVLLSGAK